MGKITTRSSEAIIYLGRLPPLATGRENSGKMPYCPKCGTSVDPNAQFCPNCGYQMTSGAPSNLQTPPSPGGMAPPYGAPTPAYSTADRDALGKIKTFALIGIIGIILGVIVPLFTMGSAFSFTSGSLSNASAIASSIIAYGVVSLVGFILGLVAIFLVRSAFSTLASVDSNKFSMPSKMVLAIFIGLILFIIAFGVFIAGIASNISTINSGGSFNAAGIAGALGLIVLAGIVSLVGIVGIILGLWRAGERYDESLLKIGGILFIIPIADVIAPFLVYFGASSAQRKVSRT